VSDGRVGGARRPGRLARWLARALGRPLTPAADAWHGPAGLDEQALVRFGRLGFVSRRRAAAGPGGEHRSRARAPSPDFADSRAYPPGDDFRRIDWSVYGRLGTLQVRLTEARERRELVLVLDCSASMRWGEPDKLAYAVRAAAALAYVGLARYDAVRLVCLGERGRRFGPLRGRARFHEVLAFLGQTQPDGPADLGAALAASIVPGSATAQPLLVVLSDLMTPSGLEAGLDALARQGAEVVVLHVLSPQEEAPDPGGEVELVDAETGETLEVGLSAETATRYRERFVAWRAGVEQACVSRGLRYVHVSTSRPLDLLMLDDLRRKQVLR
jgi:uncharacterized protein (DUF58 family)